MGRKTKHSPVTTAESAAESRLDILILKRCTGRPVGTPMDEEVSSLVCNSDSLIWFVRSSNLPLRLRESVPLRIEKKRCYSRIGEGMGRETKHSPVTTAESAAESRLGILKRCTGRPVGTPILES